MKLDINLPENFKLTSFLQDDRGESNLVYNCKGFIDTDEAEFYIKKRKKKKSLLSNEHEILQKLKNYNIPVPKVLWYINNELEEHLGLEKITGIPLWEFIDPRRKLYDQKKVTAYLTAYGEMLGKIHKIDLKHPLQRRIKLYSYDDLRVTDNIDLNRVIDWLDSNKPEHSEYVFTHSDFNLANVLFSEDRINGIIDWEWAGTGWKEYDLAWILRERIAFTNTIQEREAILKGYCSSNDFNPKTLKWCEVLNYLHWIFWCKNSTNSADNEYAGFAMNKISDLISGN